MFTHYTGNRQFDLQLNRSLGPILDRPGMDRLTRVLPRIRSTRQITQLAERLALRFDSAGDAAAAWRLYSLAAFYLPEHDPRKRRFIDAMSREFDASHAHLALSRHAIPYGDGALTAIRWEADSADRSRFPEAPATLVMMNGFDGYAEEIIGFAEHFSSRPFDIITFDGPGQGHTALAGMPLEPAWELPTNAVLDYFDLTSAAALGLSFGGYLVMRAAAHVPRISHVVAFDMMYRLLDGLTMPLPAPIRPLAASIVERARPAWLIDAAMSIGPRERRPRMEAAAGAHPDGAAQAQRRAAGAGGVHDGAPGGHDPPALPGDGGRRGPVRSDHTPVRRAPHPCGGGQP